MSANKMTSSAVSWCRNFIRLNIPKLSSTEVKISNIYLRDNSQEPTCFNHRSLQRVHNTNILDLNVHPKDVQLTSDGSILKVEWSDRHVSDFSLDWLRENVVRSKIQSKVKKQPWKASDMSAEKVMISFDDVLTSTDTLKQFYRNIWQYGVCLVTGCPLDPSASMDLSRKVGAIMHSREYFDGKQQFYEISNTNNHEDFDIAYTNAYLGLHTDNPDFEHPGSLVTLQPVKQAEVGGHSIMVDSFQVAEQLREEDPRAFQIMTSWPVTHRLQSYMCMAPIIELHDPKLTFVDYGTEVKRVKFSEMNRAPWQPKIGQDDMREWYEALRKFSKIANSKNSIFRTLLSPDTMLVFDNWRVLHGRTAFKGERKLVGCYIPYEDWVAKARALDAV